MSCARYRQSAKRAPSLFGAAIAFVLAGCDPADAPKTAAERACALNAMGTLIGVEVTSTSIKDHDRYEVAQSLLRSIPTAKEAIDFAIDFDSWDFSKRNAMQQASSSSDFAEILYKTVAPNLAESKLVTFKIRLGGVDGSISAFCGVSHGGVVRTSLRRGLS